MELLELAKILISNQVMKESDIPLLKLGTVHQAMLVKVFKAVADIRMDRSSVYENIKLSYEDILMLTEIFTLRQLPTNQARQIAKELRKVIPAAVFMLAGTQLMSVDAYRQLQLFNKTHDSQSAECLAKILGMLASAKCISHTNLAWFVAKINEKFYNATYTRLQVLQRTIQQLYLLNEQFPNNHCLSLQVFQVLIGVSRMPVNASQDPLILCGMLIGYSILQLKHYDLNTLQYRTLLFTILQETTPSDNHVHWGTKILNTFDTLKLLQKNKQLTNPIVTAAITQTRVGHNIFTRNFARGLDALSQHKYLANAQVIRTLTQHPHRVTEFYKLLTALQHAKLYTKYQKHLSKFVLSTRMRYWQQVCESFERQPWLTYQAPLQFVFDVKDGMAAVKRMEFVHNLISLKYPPTDTDRIITTACKVMCDTHYSYGPVITKAITLNMFEEWFKAFLAVSSDAGNTCYFATTVLELVKDVIPSQILQDDTIKAVITSGLIQIARVKHAEDFIEQENGYAKHTGIAIIHQLSSVIRTLNKWDIVWNITLVHNICNIFIHLANTKNSFMANTLLKILQHTNNTDAQQKIVMILSNASLFSYVSEILTLLNSTKMLFQQQTSYAEIISLMPLTHMPQLLLQLDQLHKLHYQGDGSLASLNYKKGDEKISAVNLWTVKALIEAPKQAESLLAILQHMQIGKNGKRKMIFFKDEKYMRILFDYREHATKFLQLIKERKTTLHHYVIDKAEIDALLPMMFDYQCSREAAQFSRVAPQTLGMARGMGAMGFFSANMPGTKLVMEYLYSPGRTLSC